MSAGQRRLAAIVAADVAGYSRLMGVDEEGTITALRAHRREVIEPKLAEFNGRIANTAGDSFLMEFSSAVEALRCAVEIQEEIAVRNETVPAERQLMFRIGINVGDVVANGDDLLGDGVNVAARLEALAESGGICISRSARDQVRDRMEIGLEDMGEVEVKNIARPVRAFRVLGPRKISNVTAPSTSAAKSRLRMPIVAIVGLALVVGGGIWLQQNDKNPDPAQSAEGSASSVQPAKEKPSIAILSFANQSGDKEQDYFAEGITEDITTDLSKVAGLYVTSRSATLRFRSGRDDPKAFAKTLGVAHVLEGSVRRSGDRLRVTATLIDAKTGEQLWAQRFDRNAKDVFAIQDEITSHVVRELSARLKGPALTPVKNLYTPNLEAYDFYIRGRAKRLPPTADNLSAALVMFEKAIALDPKFAGGYAGAAFVNLLRFDISSEPLPAARKKLEAATRFAEKAVELDPSFGPGWGNLAECYVRKRKFRTALVAARTAITVAPNDSLMRASYGRFLGYVGRPNEGIEQVKQAMRMSPDSLPMLYFLGANYRAAGDFAKAIEALIEHRKRLGGRVVAAPTAQLIAALAQANRPAEARAEVRAVLKAVPFFRVELAVRNHVYESAEERKRFSDALSAAGLPR
jgi:adenylate cyclase